MLNITDRRKQENKTTRSLIDALPYDFRLLAFRVSMYNKFKKEAIKQGIGNLFLIEDYL